MEKINPLKMWWRKEEEKMKKRYIILLLTFFSLVCYTISRQNETELISNLPESDLPELDSLELDLLEGWLGFYNQSGILWDEIKGSFDFYIYREDGKYYGYLCVHGSETATSCYFDERILTEIRGNQDMIQVYFLEKQKQIRGCYYEEYPEIFGTECGESKLDEAISIYQNQDLLFTLKRDEDTCTTIEGNMLLGKDQEGVVNGFRQSDQLTIDHICDKDEEIFLRMFREKEQLLEKEQPDYSSYSNDGELFLNLYLDLEEERGTGIYYGQTQISRYITQFDIVSWQPGAWEDNKYSLIRAGEQAVTTLDEYQEYREYNDQEQITSFYSEGMITGWGEPSKEKLVEIEFSYRDDGTLERKRCHYNHRLYGTTRRGETFYFNAKEQLTYVTAYITHGMLSDHYFYEDGKEEPAYRLSLDHMGHRCYGELLKYDYTSANNEQLSMETRMWQDAYAELLLDLSGNDFYLCDIDGNGIPELLIGGPSTDTDKHAEFDVYTYKGSKVECLGIVGTLRSSSLWLDDNYGILGYSYGAGGGGTYRYYIDDDILSYDGEVSGYYYDQEGNYTKWFRGADGNEIIVTEENRYEYEKIWSSMRELERYIVTDDTILTAIYGVEQQSEIKPDKSVYHLEQRQYDETIDNDELMERALTYIESAPKAPNLEFDLEGVLRREWLKKTTIFRIGALDDESILIDDYLKQQGISKIIPDNITYYNGHPLIKYYEDGNSGKIAFVATVSYGDSVKYVYCGVAYIEDLKKEGSLDYDFDQKGKLLSEKFYNNSGEQVTAISYKYNKNIPFPIITKYDSSTGEESRFFYSDYVNIGQRFWVYDSFLEFDEKDRWVKYNGDIYNDFYLGEGIESYNTPVYNEEGYLEKIIETLRGSRYQDNPDEWIEDGVIEFRYNDGGSLIEVGYRGFSGNHGSSGNSGTIYYDENGRVVHIDSFHSSGNYHRFYLYQNNENYPFAIFKIGGIPYSGDEFDGYDTIFGMDFDAWLFVDE